MLENCETIRRLTNDVEASGFFKPVTVADVFWLANA
jgi:hypothetical protein